MGRRRRGRLLNGILVLDKPQGFSSNQALQIVKRLYFAAKAGHTGSLDPLATGVLPLCLGEATKFSQFLLDADKAYDATFVLGAETTTGDVEGDVVSAASCKHIVREGVESALDGFRGQISQVPPMYSAIKQDGRPLYQLAREGREVDREARPVTIRRLDLVAFRAGEHPEIDVHIQCSKGTYIRTIAHDLGRVLGSGAHVSALRRTQAGPFALEDSVALGTLEALKNNDKLAEMDGLLLPTDAALDALPLVRLSESGGFYMRQGQPVQVPNAPCDGMVRVALESGEFLGVGEVLDDGRVAPRRMIVTGR